MRPSPRQKEGRGDYAVKFPVELKMITGRFVATAIALLASGGLILVAAGSDCKPVVDLVTSRHRAIENVSGNS